MGRDIEAALKAFKGALAVYTLESYPEQWAATQDRIGNAYSKRARGDGEDNYARAVEAYGKALTIRTAKSFPRDWAATQHNLAALLERRPRDQEKAIKAYQEALTVFTAETFPRQHMITARYLGGLFLKRSQYKLARESFESGRRAYIFLLGEGLDAIETRDLIAEVGPLFSDLAYASAALGDQSAALNFLNEGRAQEMAIALRRQALSVPAEKQTRYTAIKNDIVALARKSESDEGLEGIQAQQQLAALRGDLVTLLPEWFDRNVSQASAVQLARSVIPKGGAIVAPIITERGGKVLIVTVVSGGDVAIACLEMPSLTRNRLDGLLRGGVDPLGTGWLKAYNIQYLPPDERRLRIGEWRRAIEGIGETLWRLFMGSLDSELRRLEVVPGGRLIFLPTGALGLLPIGLARNPVTGSYFMDSYEISYSANLNALGSASEVINSTSERSLMVVSNPTGNIAQLNLPFAEIEGSLVRSYFRADLAVQLDKVGATPAAVLAATGGKSYWHFSSHGFFNWEDAREAGLRMKDDAPLTVRQLLEADFVPRPRLVVLSACETGLFDVNRRPDEFVGLPTAFIQAGAAGVLSALWQVDDLATALLMAKFYDLRLRQNLAPTKALKDAQNWLRTASKAQLLEFGETAAAKSDLAPAKLAELVSALKSRPRSGTRGLFWAILSNIRQRFQSYPFAHPYYWGGFVYAGL